MGRVSLFGSWPKVFSENSIDSWLQKVCVSHGYVLKGVTCNLVSDDELLEVNRTHLKHDFYTDIITFDYNRGRGVRGELWISKDRVMDNARSQSVSFEDELFRVMAHGVLHLCGFSDGDPDSKAQMRLEEDKALILRTL